MTPDKETANTPRTAPLRVAIVGGGIAGLTVAHELAKLPAGHEASFKITVYEQDELLGGKARSVRVEAGASTHTPGLEPARGNPGEHAMRVYLASYNSIYHIMREVSDGSGQPLIEHLKYPRFRFRRGEISYDLRADYQGIWRQLRHAIGIVRFVRRCGVGAAELVLFLYRIARLLWLSEGKLEQQLSGISFESYMGGRDRSPAFQNVVMRIAEMLVAAKRTASARVVARILLEWYVGPFLKSEHRRAGFAALSGPTSECFIDPWCTDLRSRGVEFWTGVRVDGIRESGMAVQSLEIRPSRADGTTIPPDSIEADIYVFAVQHNVLRSFVTSHLSDALPELMSLTPLGEEWSTGAQFFLTELPDSWREHAGRITIATESPWSLVFTINAPGDGVWGADVQLPSGICAVITLVASNGHTRGIAIRKPFTKCNRIEILQECFEQLLLPTERIDLDRVLQGGIAGGYLGPDLHHISEADFERNRRTRYRGYAASRIPGTSEVIVCDSQLYIRRPGNIAIEPSNRTAINNLYLAGEFTKTKYNTPTMEKSCESGMRCAAEIVRQATAIEREDYFEHRTKRAGLPLAFLRTAWFHLGFLAMGGVVVLGSLAAAFYFLIGK